MSFSLNKCKCWELLKSSCIFFKAYIMCKPTTEFLISFLLTGKWNTMLHLIRVSVHKIWERLRHARKREKSEIKCGCDKWGLEPLSPIYFMVYSEIPLYSLARKVGDICGQLLASLANRSAFPCHETFPIFGHTSLGREWCLNDERLWVPPPSPVVCLQKSRKAVLYWITSSSVIRGNYRINSSIRPVLGVFLGDRFIIPYTIQELVSSLRKKLQHQWSQNIWQTLWSETPSRKLKTKT